MTILADDLTGANDTAIQYTQHGLRAIVMTKYHAGTVTNKFNKYQVVACNTDSRALDGSEAYTTVYEATSAFFALRHDTVYKKVDSLLRGNPGYELKAVMDAIDADVAFVVSAYPKNGRIVRNGKLVTSNRSIDITDNFMTQLDCGSRVIDLENLQVPTEMLIGQIVTDFRNGIRLFIFDSIAEKDFISIGKVVAGLKLRVICCGSAGFAPYVPYERSVDFQVDPIPTVAKNGKVLVVCGTRNPVTQNQLRYALVHYDDQPCLLDVKESDEQKAIHDAVVAVETQFQAGKKEVFLAVSSVFDKVGHDRLELDDRGPEARRLAKCMGIATNNIFADCTPSALVVTGGDTSLQIVNALASYGMIPRNEIAPGIPLVSLVGGKGDGIEMITKSGGFGKESVIVDCIEYLRREK